jgi:hypothetical protein
MFWHDSKTNGWDPQDGMFLHSKHLWSYYTLLSHNMLGSGRPYLQSIVHHSIGTFLLKWLLSHSTARWSNYTVSHHSNSLSKGLPRRWFCFRNKLGFVRWMPYHHNISALLHLDDDEVYSDNMRSLMMGRLYHYSKPAHKEISMKFVLFFGVFFVENTVFIPQSFNP